MKIGIVGQGYVGTAIKVGFEPYYELETYDKYDESKTTCDLKQLVWGCEVIFVCVPTPMNEDGSCHTDIVESVIKEINTYANGLQIVVIKSTVPPGTTDMLDKKYDGVNVIFNPEFLTEANFVEDFKNQDRIILGGVRKGTNKLRQIYSKVFPTAHIIKTGSKTAEMVKYMTNSYLATKVSFANEIYQICQKIDIDYDKVVEYATLDERLGKTHLSVPGPDGDLGFGGHCFPKDLSAMLKLTELLNTTNNVLSATEKTNQEVRTDKDWEGMEGRAVS